MIDLISTGEQTRLAAWFERFHQRNVALDAELMSRVSAIVEQVRFRGDAALIEYARELDGCVIDAAALRVDENQIRTSAARVDSDVLAALREAIRNVRSFHEHEREDSWTTEGRNGVKLGQRVTPIEKAGVYVPGGSASYPSSVVMNIVPAQIAGVERIVVATPPGVIEDNPAVAAALVELGITEGYAAGGAQAIAALAYGTETVPRVDKIVGPGNRYVTAAKKVVFGIVGIDALAGPSEVVIVADESALAGFVAADLLAQAEHSDDAAAVLITTSPALAEQVLEELTSRLRRLPRAAIAGKSLASHGAIIIAQNLDECCALANELAPEHLQIIARDEELIASQIRNAGAIFLGEYTPEAVGDYLAGPNHVLPTSGAARFSSGLSVRDFVKRTNTLKFTAAALRETASMIATLARAEGLEGHAQSALARTGRDS